MFARTTFSVFNKSFQKFYRVNRYVFTSFTPSASSARHVIVSFLVQILKYSKSRLMLKLVIKLSKKIRNYTKEEFIKI